MSDIDYVGEANEGQQQQMADDERSRASEEMRCPRHPDRPVVDAWVCTKQCCLQCLEDKLARYADHAARDWCGGSDYRMSGRDLMCDTTRGAQTITTFEPGEKIR